MDFEKAFVPRILVCDPMGKMGVNIMAKHFNVDVKPDLKSQELKTIIGEYHAVVVGKATKLSAIT